MKSKKELRNIIKTKRLQLFEANNTIEKAIILGFIEALELVLEDNNE